MFTNKQLAVDACEAPIVSCEQEASKNLLAPSTIGGLGKLFAMMLDKAAVALDLPIGGTPIAKSTGYVVCDCVGKVFGQRKAQFEALKNVSFVASEKEFVALLGPSGCGKTTVLMMVGGLENATSGRISIGGKQVTGPRPEVGIMFQDPTLLPWKTALDNVLFPIRIMRKPIAKYRNRAEELLEIVGLGRFRDKKPLELSGGMRQRVALCRALIHEPRLLLMDEPFSALDAITRDEMNIVLTDMWTRFQSTALFVTHSIREAVFLSDRVIVLGAHPSTIIADVRIDFRRPRDVTINESREFNEVCALLRSKVELAHSART